MKQDDGQTPDIDPVQAFLEGSLRKEIGLKSEDLSVGLEVARNHLKRGAPAEALRMYVGLILCEPMNVDFQVGLANCAITLGEDHLALQAASAVVALAPRDPRGYYLSGRACLGLGHLAEAEEDLNDALAHARKTGDATVASEAQRLLKTLTAIAPPSAATA